MHLYASAAAPNPLSMFTTPTPGEQVLSIVNMALMPPNETPYPMLQENNTAQLDLC